DRVGGDDDDGGDDGDDDGDGTQKRMEMSTEPELNSGNGTKSFLQKTTTTTITPVTPGLNDPHSAANLSSQVQTQSKDMKPNGIVGAITELPISNLPRNIPRDNGVNEPGWHLVAWPAKDSKRRAAVFSTAPDHSESSGRSGKTSETMRKPMKQLSYGDKRSTEKKPEVNKRRNYDLKPVSRPNKVTAAASRKSGLKVSKTSTKKSRKAKISKSERLENLSSGDKQPERHIENDDDDSIEMVEKAVSQLRFLKNSREPNHLYRGSSENEVETLIQNNFLENEPDVVGSSPSGNKTLSEARAAERRALAQKRREAVEKKRKEREEEIRREKETKERQEKIHEEMEIQRLMQEEEARSHRQQLEEERRRKDAEEEEAERRQRAEAEVERQRREEHARKLRLLRMRQLDEEQRRQELVARQREEAEEERKAEEEKVQKMAAQERMEYEREKKEKEEMRLKEEEDKRLRREEEAKEMMAETLRLAEEKSRQMEEMEARLRFNQSLKAEAIGLIQSQTLTRAFVFSYFELLKYLNKDEDEDGDEEQAGFIGKLLKDMKPLPATATSTDTSTTTTDTTTITNDTTTTTTTDTTAATVTTDTTAA
ncbi:hypothetical protein Ahia01_001165500, partial [Argonauta hians]